MAAYFDKPVLREVDESAFYADIAGVRKNWGDRAVLRAIHFLRTVGVPVRYAVPSVRIALKTFLELIVAGGHSSFEYNQNAYSAKNPREQGVSLGLALLSIYSRGMVRGVCRAAALRAPFRRSSRCICWRRTARRWTACSARAPVTC